MIRFLSRKTGHVCFWFFFNNEYIYHLETTGDTECFIFECICRVSFLEEYCDHIYAALLKQMNEQCIMCHMGVI